MQTLYTCHSRAWRNSGNLKTVASVLMTAKPEQNTKQSSQIFLYLAEWIKSKKSW